MIIAASISPPPTAIRQVRASPRNRIENSAAQAGSVAMVMAARDGARCACAHDWTIIATAPDTTAM